MLAKDRLDMLTNLLIFEGSLGRFSGLVIGTSRQVQDSANEPDFCSSLLVDGVDHLPDLG